MTEPDKPGQASSDEHGSDAPASREFRQRLIAGMKPLISLGVLRPLILGMLLGGLVATRFSERIGSREIEQPTGRQKNWPPAEFHSTSGWSYVKVDESGWSTGPVGTFEDLDKRLGSPLVSGEEIVIPLFTTVYAPSMVDKLYYDAILESDIEQGDKVLVIGTGSGADAWVASLKSKALVYVVEVNPMAVVNARATARLGNFQINPIVGDITKVDLPNDFRDFDFVLWNMPFVWKKQYLSTGSEMEEESFHDGDDGTILKNFLTLLPSLLKKGGKAIVLNSASAADFIPTSATMTKTNDCVLFVIPNP